MTIPALPNERDAVPPAAERCRDATERDGFCRHSAVCHDVRQRFQQRIVQMTGARCPWWQGLTAVRHYELEG